MYSIKSTMRIQSSLFHTWQAVISFLKERMMPYNCESLDDDTMIFSVPDSKLLYTVMLTGPKRMVLRVEDHVTDLDYEIEFSKLGVDVRIVFTGDEKYFMKDTMASLFEGLTWNRNVIRESIEIVQYE
jgi:hypothetical protein